MESTAPRPTPTRSRAPASAGRRGPRIGARLVAAILGLQCAAARAEPAQVEQPEEGRRGVTEEIEVTGHYRNKVGSDDAASAGTVGRQLVEDRPVLRPGEVLELVPGLIITQHSGAGKANQYFLRGFNLDHGTDFLTTLDGVPLNLRTHAHGQGYTDLNSLIPELISRVDYLKGPYYASKGDFASAGAADIRYAESLPRSTVALTAGSFGYYRALGTGSAGLAGGSFLYGLELMHEDGPWLRPDDYRKLNAVLRYSRAVGEGMLSLAAMAYAGTWNATDQVPLRAVQSGVLDRFGTLDPTTGGSSHRYSLSAGWSQPLWGGTLSATAYAVRYGLHLFSNFTYFLDHPEGDQFEQADSRWYFGTAGMWEWGGAWGSLGSRLRAGWEARRDEIEPVGLYQTLARQRLSTTRQDDVAETSGALFAEVELRWLPWLRTSFGLRGDEYAFEVRSSDRRNSGTASAGRLSPKLSAVVGPWHRTELFVNLGQGFHSNDARGVLTRVDPSSGEAVQPVTPLVRTRGGEIGARTELLPGVQTSLALWRLDIDSELLFTGDAGTTEPSRPSRRQGVEWSTRWQPVRWLLFDLDLAASKARFTRPDPADPSLGPYIPGAIGTAISAGASIHELGPWSASLFLRYFGPRPLVEDGSVRSSSSALLNAQASYRVARWLRVTADAFNLLGARVDDIAYFYPSLTLAERQAGSAPVSGIHFHPAESRSIRLAVAAEL